MKLKKILASSLAALIAVSAMAISTSAATEHKAYIKPWSGKSGEAANFVFEKQYAGGWVQFTPIDDAEATTPVTIADAEKFDIVIEFETTALPEGDLIFKGGDTSSEDNAIFAVEGQTTYKKTFKASALNIAEADDAGAGNIGFNVQFNFAAEGPWKTTIKNIYAVSNVPEETEAPKTDNKPADTDKPADDDKGGKDKDNTETGVDGLAAIAAVTLLAGAAVVVSRKRK